MSNYLETTDLALLESLIVDNPDLERLEALLDQFNIFESLGAVRVELRHSDFLAFLLNPNQSHGLGDVFAKRLLQKALATTQNHFPITPIDLDLYDLDSMVVLREWQNIDILLVDEENKLAVIIENKIGSSEHGDQLKRYRRIVSQHYPDLRQVCLFLTPEGDEPSDQKYISIDYLLVAELIEELVESRASTLGPDVRTLMTHYSQMLRRHIVSESEIADLCRKIYRKHQRALDMIYEYRPDQQAAIREILESLVQAEPTLNLDHCSKSYIRFAPKTWDQSELLLQGSGWTRSKRILLFEFGSYPDRLRLSLIIGPGPVDTRQRLMEMAQNHHPFKPASKSLGKMYNTIYVRDWLRAKDYEDTGIDDLEAEIRNRWSQFLEHDLPEIHEIIKKQEWIVINLSQ
jgi:hypothetical protein